MEWAVGWAGGVTACGEIVATSFILLLAVANACLIISLVHSGNSGNSGKLEHGIRREHQPENRFPVSNFSN
jgi:hypothetical protein